MFHLNFVLLLNQKKQLMDLNYPIFHLIYHHLIYHHPKYHHHYHYRYVRHCSSRLLPRLLVNFVVMTLHYLLLCYHLLFLNHLLYYLLLFLNLLSYYHLLCYLPKNHFLLNLNLPLYYLPKNPNHLQVAETSHFPLEVGYLNLCCFRLVFLLNLPEKN